MEPTISNKIEPRTEIWQYKVVEYIAYLVVILTPLYFNINHWYPFGTPKVSIFIGESLFMAIFYAWGALINKKFFIRFTPMHIALGVFLLILTFSSIFGIDPRNSFFGIFSFPTNMILIYILSLFACIIGFLIRSNKKFLPNVLLVSFLTSIIVALFSYTNNSIFKIFSDYCSTIGNSSYTGAYLLFNICFGVGLFFYYKKDLHRMLAIIGVLFIIFCPIFFNINVLSGVVKVSEAIKNPFLFVGVADGATLGIIISFIFIGLLSIFSFSKKNIWKYISVSIIFIILAWVFYFGYLLTDTSSKINAMYMEHKTENRLVAWKVAEKGMLEHPVLGYGLNNFYYVNYKYFKGYFLGENQQILLQPHNIIWEYASNTGILGLTSYLALLFTVFAILSRYKQKGEDRYKIFCIIIMGILFGYFIQNLFIFDSITTFLMFFLVVGITMGLSNKYWEFNFTKNREIFKYIISPILILVSFTSIILFAILPWRESKQRMDSFLNRNNKELISFRMGLQDISLFGGVEDSAYTSNKLLNIYIENLYKVNNTNKKDFIKEIDSLSYSLEKDIILQPNNAHGYIVNGRVLSFKLFVLGEFDEDLWNKAFFNFNKAKEFNPFQPEIYIDIAQLYAYKEDYLNARIYIKQSLTIAPKNHDSYVFADKLQELSKDEEFGNYIKIMESRWLIEKFIKQK